MRIFQIAMFAAKHAARWNVVVLIWITGASTVRV